MATQAGPSGGTTFGAPPQAPGTGQPGPTKHEQQEAQRRMALEQIARASIEEYKTANSANEASMSQEQKVEALRVIFFRRLQESQGERIKQMGSLMESHQNWWENLSPQYRTIISSTFVAVGTGVALWAGDYASGGKAILRVVQRVGTALVTNYAIRKLKTFSVVKGIGGIFKKNQPATSAEGLDSDTRQKFDYIKWALAAGGIGLSAAFGGWVIALIAGGGMIAKGIIDFIYEKMITEREKIKREVERDTKGVIATNMGSATNANIPELNATGAQMSPELENLIKHLADQGQRYDKITKDINMKKFQKGCWTGAVSLTASITTATVPSYGEDVEVEQTQAQIKPGEKAPWEIETQPQGSAEAKAIAEAHAKFDAEHPSDKGLTPEELAKKYPEAPFAKDVHEKSEVEPAEDKPEAKVDPEKVKEAEEELRAKKNDLIKEKMDLEKAKGDLEEAEKSGKKALIEAKKEALEKAEEKVEGAEKNVKGAEEGLEKAKTGEGSPDKDASPDASAEEEKTIDVKDIEKEAVIGKGDGITYAFKRQLEENEDLAEKLKEQIGYEGKVGTPKFYMAVGKYYGYLDGEGHEIRTNYDADDKVAYQFREVDGKIVVDEITFEKGGDVGTIQETKGLDGEEDFENKDYEKPYEYNDGEEHHYSGNSKPDIEKAIDEDTEVKDLDGGDEYESQYSTSELAENKDGFEKIKEETWEEVKGMSALEYFTNVQDDKDAFNTLNAIYREAEARNDVPSLNELKALEEAGTPMSLEDLINKSRDMNHMNDLKEAREAQEELEKINEQKKVLEKKEEANIDKEAIRQSDDAIDRIYKGWGGGRWSQIKEDRATEFLESNYEDMKRNHKEIYHVIQELRSNLIDNFGRKSYEVSPEENETMEQYLDYLIKENIKEDYKNAKDIAVENAIKKVKSE